MPNFKLNDKHTDIAKAQILLWTPEEELDVDGHLGPQTEAALRAFQQRASLPISGVIDDKTWDAIHRFKFLKDIPLFQHLDLSPTASRQFRSPNLTKSYNAYGRLVFFICLYLGIPEKLAHSIIAVESAGSGFNKGRLVIRFENHIFKKYLNHQDFSRWFKYDSQKIWLNHETSFDDGKTWESVHTSQDQEWKVFEFASSKNKEAAAKSISMGAGQMMGFNHQKLGYANAVEMFTAMLTGDRAGIIGMFDFIRGNSALYQAIKAQDIKTFVSHYNGSGQVETYSNLINKAMSTWS